MPEWKKSRSWHQMCLGRPSVAVFEAGQEENPAHRGPILVIFTMESADIAQRSRKKGVGR